MVICQLCAIIKQTNSTSCCYHNTKWSRTSSETTETTRAGDWGDVYAILQYFYDWYNTAHDMTAEFIYLFGLKSSNLGEQRGHVHVPCQDANLRRYKRPKDTNKPEVSKRELCFNGSRFSEIWHERSCVSLSNASWKLRWCTSSQRASTSTRPLRLAHAHCVLNHAPCLMMI